MVWDEVSGSCYFEQFGGIKPATISKIQRQKNTDYRNAVKSISNGQVEKGYYADGEDAYGMRNDLDRASLRLPKVGRGAPAVGASHVPSTPPAAADADSGAVAGAGESAGSATTRAVVASGEAPDTAQVPPPSAADAPPSAATSAGGSAASGERGAAPS